MKNKYSRYIILALVALIILLFAFTLKMNARAMPLQQEITGIVADEEGIPIPGVAVTVKGTDRGTVTNLKGKFSLIAGPGDVLVFKHLGFKAKEMKLLGRTSLEVVLAVDATALDEVQINAGYYNTTRRERTGNISRITAEEIEQQPVISPLQVLQGRMAGVEVIPGANQPGMAPTIRIRGRNSLREEGNLPLYIIDGVPVNSTPIGSNTLLGTTGIDPLNTLNLSNIQSIEVLKDADATAIYGSRGANGVILITTKKGSYTNQGLQVSFYKGSSWLPNRLDLLNTAPYLEIRRKAFENDGVEPKATNAVDLVVWDQERYTDWQDVILGGNSLVQDINLSASESTQNTSFRLGGSYHNQGSIFPGEMDYTKLTAALGVNHLSKNGKLALDLSVNYGLDNISSLLNSGLSSHAYNLPPNAPRLFNEDGSLHWEEWSYAGSKNPLEGFFNTGTTKSHNLISNLGITYTILPGISLKSTFGYTNFRSKELIKMPRRSYNPSSWESLDHSSYHLDNDRESCIVEPQLVLEKKVGRVGVDAIMGASIQESDLSTTSFLGEGYVAENLIGNLTAAERLAEATGRNIKYRYAAIFGRLGLNWDQRIFINFTGRRDGSSRFGPGKKFANFGAIGGAWIFQEEPQEKNQNFFLSFGKIRASYGTTGNDQIGDYGFMDSYETTPGPGGLYPTQLANPDYSWEVNKKLEAAIELGFLKDRINLGVSWFQNRSSNQLVGYALPSTTGFTTILANLPATVENKGIEVELSTLNFEGEKFTWQSFFNFTLPKNELISYPDIEQSTYANTYRIGHPLDILLLYEYAGVDSETGFYSVTDVNEDGRFNFLDKVVIQDLSKIYFGGLSNDLSYENFSLQFLFDFVKQEGSLGLFDAGVLGNQRAEVLDVLNENSSYQQLSASSRARMAYARVLQSNLPIVDASFVRLKTLSLGYNFPSSVLKHIWLNKAKVFLNGQNLLTLTNYQGLDPELPRGGTQFSGLRTVTAGLQLQF